MFDVCSKINKHLPWGKKQDDHEQEDELDNGQEHVFWFYEDLDEEQKRELDDDYEELKKRYEHTEEGKTDETMEEKIERYWAEAGKHQEDVNKGHIIVDPPRMMNWELKKPPPIDAGANITRLTDVGERKLNQWRSLGFELYQKGKVALVVLSGGLDSRLGENVPKGVLNIGLLSQKSIFQLYAERIKRLQHLVHRKFKRMSYLPLYIMCNQTNYEIVEEFWRENNWFGLREQDVLFFVQGYFPALDKKGKFLLQEKHKIRQYPCGNGAMFRSLADEGMVSDMKSRSVTCMYACSIDNVLAKIGDPLFLGFCETCKAECGLKCIEKLVPEEKFGVYCSKHQKVHEDVDGDGKLDMITKYKAAVFEFFEIPDEQKKRRAKNGGQSLEFCAGNLSQYYFRIDFVMKVKDKLKTFHLIEKRIDHIDLETGERRIMSDIDDKNGYRLEMWVFDAFEHSSKVVGLQVSRDEYALVKKEAGPDSPQTALQAVGKLHQNWVLAAGGEFYENKVASENEDAKCEISPLVSYEGEDLFGQFLKPIRLPFYLPSQMELAEACAVPPAMQRNLSIHYLDVDGELAQRELQMELNGNLGKVRERIQAGNAELLDYNGEIAEAEEQLPPTPRVVDHSTYLDDLRTSPRGASARLSKAGMSARSNLSNVSGFGASAANLNASASAANLSAVTSGRKASEHVLAEANLDAASRMALKDKEVTQSSLSLKQSPGPKNVSASASTLRSPNTHKS